MKSGEASASNPVLSNNNRQSDTSDLNHEALKVNILSRIPEDTHQNEFNINSTLAVITALAENKRFSNPENHSNNTKLAGKKSEGDVRI